MTKRHRPETSRKGKKPTVADLDASLSVLHAVATDHQRELQGLSGISVSSRGRLDDLEAYSAEYRNRINQAEARLMDVEVAIRGDQAESFDFHNFIPTARVAGLIARIERLEQRPASLWSRIRAFFCTARRVANFGGGDVRDGGTWS